MNLKELALKAVYAITKFILQKKLGSAMVKCATSLFNSLSSNVARFLLPALP